MDDYVDFFVRNG